MEELSAGRFEPVIGEADSYITPAKVKRVVFCSGKIYYEILNTRRERKIKDIALLRLEQLYPFPHEYIEKQIKNMPPLLTLFGVRKNPAIKALGTESNTICVVIYGQTSVDLRFASVIGVYGDGTPRYP